MKYVDFVEVKCLNLIAFVVCKERAQNMAVFMVRLTRQIS